MEQGLGGGGALGLGVLRKWRAFDGEASSGVSCRTVARAGLGGLQLGAGGCQWPDK